MVGFFVFIVCWVLSDYMKAFPNYHYCPVDIAGLRVAEFTDGLLQAVLDTLWPSSEKRM